MMKSEKTIAAMAIMFMAVSCQQNEEASPLIKLDDSPVYRELPDEAAGRMPTDSRYAVLSAEYIVVDGIQKVGRTVYFKNVGNKQLTEDFVPGLDLDGTSDISFYIDENRPSDDLDVAITSAAIGRAMSTWDAVTCSDLGMYQVPSDKGVPSGFVSAILGFGGSTSYVADVVHAGWLPGSFFDLVDEDGSEYILGVTFTIIFTDDDGNPVDVDNNGKIDVAWREIYYNDAFEWNDGAHYDVETIALHEAGHALSQGHFGTAFFNRGTGYAQFSPRAVMNAAYSGIQTQIQATDNAGHCSNWSSWPNN